MSFSVIEFIAYCSVVFVVGFYFGIQIQEYFSKRARRNTGFQYPSKKELRKLRKKY